MITVIDYGRGNLRSVQKGFESQGVEVRLTNSPGEVTAASGLVLPGVGSFGDCINNLEKQNLTGPISDFIKSGKPFLGICLGLQVLFESSEESPDAEGLGIVKGKVVKFPIRKREGLKVPQMGWNRVHTTMETEIFRDIPQDSWFYFVHSYYVAPEENGIGVMKADYGMEFTAGIVKENIAAFQFHPEKSSDLGLRILKNFAGLCS